MIESRWSLVNLKRKLRRSSKKALLESTLLREKTNLQGKKKHIKNKNRLRNCISDLDQVRAIKFQDQARFLTIHKNKITRSVQVRVR